MGHCVKLCRLPFGGAAHVLLGGGRVGPWPGDVGRDHRHVMTSGVSKSGCLGPCRRVRLSTQGCVGELEMGPQTHSVWDVLSSRALVLVCFV